MPVSSIAACQNGVRTPSSCLNKPPSCLTYKHIEKMNQDMAKHNNSSSLTRRQRQILITHLATNLEDLDATLKAKIRSTEFLHPNRDDENSDPEVQNFEPATSVVKSTQLEVTRKMISSASASLSHLRSWRTSLEITPPVLLPTPQPAFRPANPTLSSGEPRFKFSRYELTLPTTVHVTVLVSHKEKCDWFTRIRQRENNDLIVKRLLKRVGLREWEWSCGEPVPSSAVVEPNATAVLEKEINRSSKNKAHFANMNNAKEPLHECSAQTYDQRVQKFTYTYGDDPVFRGRRMAFTRRRELLEIKGDYSKELSPEDKAYIAPKPKLSKSRKPRPADNESLKVEIDGPRQLNISAGDYMTGGGTDRWLVGEAEQWGRESSVQRKTSTDSGCSVVSDDSWDD